jgi:(5-formylfuran-3-yl)methyl phosphate synthase
MLLMVSVQDLAEALEAVKGKADIVDVKNLRETVIGSNFPPVIREVRKAFPKEIHVSVTLGAVPNQAGTVSLAVFGAAALGATSVKVGLVESDHDSGLRILQESKRALEGYPTKLIAATFADSHLYHGIDPSLVVPLARDSHSDGILIDTLTKDGRNLFDFMPEAKLKRLVDEAKELGMSTALSGALRMTDLDVLTRINPDIVGVRGAVCTNGDRYGGKIDAAAVGKVKHALDLRLRGEIDVFAKAAPVLHAA